MKGVKRKAPDPTPALEQLSEHATDETEGLSGEYLSFLTALDANALREPRSARKKRKKEAELKAEREDERAVEKSYESKLHPAWEEKVERLPIKRLDGTLAPAETRGNTEEEDDETSKHASKLVDSSTDHYGDTADKKSQKRKQKKKKQKDNTTASDDEDNDPTTAMDPNDPPHIVELKLLARRQRRLARKKEQMALLASQIIENPEENLNKLAELHALTQDPKDETVRKYALLSELAVYKDILPSYRIRIPTEQELAATKLSKEVRRLREYERTLLKHYSTFLQSLTPLVGSNLIKRASADSLSLVAVRCLGELLHTHPHFNFRSDIIRKIVPLMTARDDRITEMCCHAVEQLFIADAAQLDATLELVRAIADFIKEQEKESRMLDGETNDDKKGHKSHKRRVQVVSIKPRMLRVFLSLKLTEALSEEETTTNPHSDKYKKHKKPSKTSKDANGHLSKRQRREAKTEAEVARELSEAEARESEENYKRKQTELLKAVFLTYFRILLLVTNSANAATATTTVGALAAARRPTFSMGSPEVAKQLLPEALQGLARFAHLINVGFMIDLLRSLRALIKIAFPENNPMGDATADVDNDDNKSPLTLLDGLHCVHAALHTLKLQGEALNVDLKEFYAFLYALLWQLIAKTTDEAVWEQALKCLQLLVFDSKQLSADRMAAFAKRLGSVAMSTSAVSPSSAIGILHCIWGIVRRHHKTASLFDAERPASGVHLPDIDDPEHCNPFAAALWELAVMARRHWHPTVAKIAGGVIAAAAAVESTVPIPSTPSAELPLMFLRTPTLALWRYYVSAEARGEFVPPLPTPPSHTLQRLIEKDRARGNQRKHYFVQLQRREADSEFMVALRDMAEAARQSEDDINFAEVFSAQSPMEE